jgi:hypothetical protein
MRKFNLITIRNDRQFRAFTGLPESVFNLYGSNSPQLAAFFGNQIPRSLLRGRLFAS